MLGETLRPGGLELTSHVAAIGGITKGQMVLEIGCGKGATAVFLAQHYSCCVTGIDLSEEMVSCARTRAIEENLTNQTNFLVSDAERLPFDDGTFDIVIAECTFSLVRDQAKTVREILRVLKTGGRFVLTDIILKGKPEQIPDDSPSCLARTHTADEYNELFNQSGFSPLYFEDRSETMKNIAFNLALSGDGINETTWQILLGQRQKCLPQTSSAPAISALDLLVQYRIGYAVFIFRKNKA